MTLVSALADKTLGPSRREKQKTLRSDEKKGAVRTRPTTTMQPYRNLAGNSGVAAFQVLPDGIEIRFVGGATYLYDVHASGREHIEEMKRMAQAGRGLSSYIARNRVRYAGKAI